MVYFGYILFFFGFLTLDVIFVTNGGKIFVLS